VVWVMVLWLRLYPLRCISLQYPIEIVRRPRVVCGLSDGCAAKVRNVIGAWVACAGLASHQREQADG